MNSKPTRISAPRTSMRLSSMTFWILFFSSVIYSPRSRPSSSPRHKNDARYPLWRRAAKNYLPDYTFWRLEKPFAFRANHLSRNCRSQPTCPRDIRRHFLDQGGRARRVLARHFNGTWRQGQLPSGQTAKARTDYRVQSLHKRHGAIGSIELKHDNKDTQYKNLSSCDS